MLAFMVLAVAISDSNGQGTCRARAVARRCTHRPLQRAFVRYCVTAACGRYVCDQQQDARNLHRIAGLAIELRRR